MIHIANLMEWEESVTFHMMKELAPFRCSDPGRNNDLGPNDQTKPRPN